MGRSAAGISNLAFLFLAITGLYIWWPKQLTLQHVRAIVWFRRTSTGRARDFNWHNTIGFWCLIPIVIMTVSGAVLSYPWANNLVYRLTGSPLPSPRGGQAEPVAPRENRIGSAQGGDHAVGRGRAERSPSNGAAAEGYARPRSGGREATGRADRSPGLEGNEQQPAVIPAELDRMWALAEKQMPTWSLLLMRLPNRGAGPVVFTITDGANWNAFARSTLTMNGSTGELIQWQPYEKNNLGQKVRGWLRFAHTGELGGLTGQIIAGVGCLGGVFLVYTGLSLAFRRLWNWALWKRMGSSTRRLPSVPSIAPASTSARDAVME